MKVVRRASIVVRGCGGCLLLEVLVLRVALGHAGSDAHDISVLFSGSVCPCHDVWISLGVCRRWLEMLKEAFCIPHHVTSFVGSKH